MATNVSPDFGGLVDLRALAIEEPLQALKFPVHSLINSTLQSFV